MASSRDVTIRLAGPADAPLVARLLHDFNTEFDTPSPGVDALERRARDLLGGDTTVAILADRPAIGLAVVTFRPNVWYVGPVALLDELYVVPAQRGRGVGSQLVDRLLALCDERAVELIEINVDESDVDAQRFYERHGFAGVDPDTGERAFYFSRELGDAP